GRGFGANPQPLAIGLNVFRIRAIDEAGGTTDPTALRRLYVNFSPDTWFAGPNVNQLGANLARDSLGWYFPLAPNPPLPGDFPGSPIGNDTLYPRPAERPPVRSFVEARRLLSNTLRYYVRSEGDTIALNSQVIARLGGLDKDSPYAVRGGSPSDSSR